MTAGRERLPNRRATTTFEIELHGLHYTASVSHFADGRPAEIFLQNHKPGSQSGNARDCAIVCSIALQFGADLEIIRKALCRDAHGRPSGPLAAVLDMIVDGGTP